MNTPKNMVGLALLSIFLGGCAASQKSVQDSYRVDPVMVHYDKRAKSAIECGSPADSSKNTKQAIDSTSRDVLCAIDLDTYVFPSDRVRSATRLAYDRVAACQERTSSIQYSITKTKAVQNAASTHLQSIRIMKSYEDNVQQAEFELAKAKDDLTRIDQAILKANKAKRVELDKQKEIVNKRIEQLDKRKKDADKVLDSARADRSRAEVAEKNAITELETIAKERGTSFAAGVDDPETCRILRNMLQDEIVSRSQQMCKKHLADTNATSSVINTELGFASIVFSTLGAVVGGVQGKSVLSGLAGASGATQTLINKEIYRDFVVPAIGRAINSDRDRKLQEIWADQSKDLSNYSLTKSIVDAGDFHERCSFAHGLLLLGTDAEKRTAPRVEELQAQIESNNALIDRTEKTLRHVDETDAKDKLVRPASSQQEKDIVANTVERLRRENDAIAVRINLMKRAQNPN